MYYAIHSPRFAWTTPQPIEAIYDVHEDDIVYNNIDRQDVLNWIYMQEHNDIYYTSTEQNAGVQTVEEYDTISNIRALDEPQEIGEHLYYFSHTISSVQTMSLICKVAQWLKNGRV